MWMDLMMSSLMRCTSHFFTIFKIIFSHNSLLPFTVHFDFTTAHCVHTFYLSLKSARGKTDRV